MLQNIRKNAKGTGAKIIVGLIVMTFALFGVESILTGGGVQYVAEVNGEGISAAELQQQINQQKRRLLMSMGDDIDPAMLDDQIMAGPALDFIIQKQLLLQAAADYGLAVSDTRLGEYIATMEVFQTDGQFDPVLYRSIISDQGYSPAGFQQALREDLIMSQLRAGLASSEFVTPLELDRMAGLNDEQRDIRYMILPMTVFRSEAEVSDEEILAWYEQHQDRFMTEESVELEYIELRASDFAEPVADEVLREQYEIDKDNFVASEERRVSHILFEPKEDESEAELQARINTAEERLAGGSDEFALLAEELSDDIGSSSLGGDLGYTDGEVFPPEMEEAIAGLQLNEVSAAVRTDAGWHLIKVTDIRGAESRPFEDVRAELEAGLQQEQASRELIKTVESLRDLVFNADDLAGPASELGLEVSRSGIVKRDQQEGLFANPRLSAAAFAGEVLNDGYNSDVIEVAAEHFVVLRVVNHTLPAVKPLEAVRSDVVVALSEEQARGAIRERAVALLQELRAGASIEELALANEFTWQVELAARRNNPVVPATLLRRAFQLQPPADDSSTFDFVQNSDGDIELFELVRVIEGDAENLGDAQRRGLSARLLNEASRRTDDYFQQQLRSSADIVRS
jgi:peptidyl-prolyl cis-trans isomerase D